MDSNEIAYLIFNVNVRKSQLKVLESSQTYKELTIGAKSGKLNIFKQVSFFKFFKNPSQPPFIKGRRLLEGFPPWKKRGQGGI
jgi:hypothetical protein